MSRSKMDQKGTRSIVFMYLLVLATIVCQAAEATDSSTTTKPISSSSSHSTATQQRSGGSAASLVGALGALVPNLIANVAPLMLLFGLGALMMPALGMGAMGLLREGRRSSSEQPFQGGLPLPYASYARPLQTSPQDIYYFSKRSFPSLLSGINSASVMQGVQDVLERVLRAIDNADKRYN